MGYIRETLIRTLCYRFGVPENFMEQCISQMGMVKGSEEEKKILIEILNDQDKKVLKPEYTPVSLQKKIFDRCQEIFALAESMYPVKLGDVRVMLQTTNKAAGLASFQPSKGYFLMLNPKYNHSELIKETIPHEVAHLVCMKMNTIDGHGPIWKRVAKSLGSTGNMYYTKGPGLYRKTYRYSDTNGRLCHFSSQIHSKIQKGQSYINPESGGLINKDCSYEII